MYGRSNPSLRPRHVAIVHEIDVRGAQGQDTPDVPSQGAKQGSECPAAMGQLNSQRPAPDRKPLVTHTIV